MKRKGIIVMIALFTGFILMFPILGIAGSQQPLMQIAKPPVPPKKQIKSGQPPKKVVKVYKIGIEKLELTNKCQLKLVLKNKRADLSAVLHKKSTLKISRNRPLSFCEKPIEIRGGIPSCLHHLYH